MGLFDFFKPKSKGVEEAIFSSTQFQNQVCAVALLKLKENNGDGREAAQQLKKIGLSDEQAEYIVTKTRDIFKRSNAAAQQPSGIPENKFGDTAYQAEVLERAKNTYFQNNHDYSVVKQSLLTEGLSESQANDMIAKLKKNIAAMVDDFQQQLDSGAITSIKVQPNPEHKKGSVGPDQVDRYIAYGAYQMERGDLDNALELFDKAIELDENATLAYANKGSLFAEKGDNKKALQFYNKALAIEPRNLQILENKMDILFVLMSEASEEEEFIETVKTILKVDAAHPNALIYIIQYHLKNNEIDAALTAVKKLFADYHREHITIGLLLKVFDQLGEERARAEFGAYKNTLGPDAQYQLEYCKGLYFKGIGLYDEATGVFERLNLLQEFSWSYYQMAIMKNLQNKTDEALALLSKTFSLEPELKNDAKEYPELQNLWADARFIALTK